MSRLEIGDCREILRRWIVDGVRAQMCVTSPPYWGLRDYGVDGQLGLEATPEEFVVNMVEVFRLMREVLADDGTLWLNLGDSYAAGKMGRDDSGDNGRFGGQRLEPQERKAPPGLKPKDLVGIPWRLAFALQADGWYLRSDIIWHKPNPMPESVTDRPTKAHEYLFLVSKRAKYYYDADAVREAHSERSLLNNPNMGMGKENAKTFGKEKRAEVSDQGVKVFDRGYFNPAGRNRRSVWTIATQAYSEAHFATFPEKLVEPCILAGSRPGDVVLDPFFGSGTTGQVAERLGRRWLGCELNPSYVDMGKKRAAQQGLRLEPAQLHEDFLDAEVMHAEAMWEVTRLIGTCHTCRVRVCPHPRHRVKRPMEGCTKWDDEERA